MDSEKLLQRRKVAIRASEKKNVQEVRIKSLDISKVIRLLEDPLTANLKERHLFLLKKLLTRNQNGFLLRELTDVNKILNMCADKAKDHPEYVSVLCDLLRVCRLPFLKEKASDELSYAQTVTEFISDIGYLMRVSHAEVRQQIIECVKSFYSCIAAKQLPDGPDCPTDTQQSDNTNSALSRRLQPTSPSYKLQLLERSGLAQTLLLSMAAVEKQPAIKLQLLQTLQLLSSSSDVNCALMLSARGAETVCLHMNEPDPSGQILLRSAEILLNLLERSSKEQVTAQLGSMESILSLKEAFSYQLQNSFSRSDLQLRNDLLLITTLIAEDPKSLLIESLFAKQLMVYVTFPELKSHNPLVRNLQLTYNNEDFQMKKLLLNLLVCLSKSISALKLFTEERVMLSLLTLTKPPAAASEGREGLRHWSSVQYEELQLQALVTLTTLAPLLLDDYVCCQGNSCLLLLLDWCIGRDSYFGEGQGFHGAGGRGSKKAQMRHCIRVLRSVTSQAHESVNQDLCDQGIISQLVGTLMQTDASPEDEDQVTVEMKSDIQLILSELCDDDMHRKELFGSDGVEMVVHFLRRGSDKFYSGLGHNRLILSTVDCVRSCIVGCYTTEDYFLAKDGSFLLLDMLSSSPRSVHSIVLTSMLELCDNPNAVSHILSWRGAGGQTAPGLLLQLWREEEAELGVSRNQHGVIADPRRPILTRYQQEDEQPSLPASAPSAAVLEMSENLRSKIYAIFCKFGFLDLPGLSTTDYVTLSIIRRYLDFKAGEVWEEIRRELILDGVRPVSPDEEALSTICKITEDTAGRTAAEQSSILEQQEEEDTKEEELLYTEIKSHWKQQELTAKSWELYVAKTSNYNTLKEVKEQRDKDTDSSRQRSKHKDATLHPAERFMGRVMTTETSDAPGPSGAKLKLARAPIKAAAQEDATPPEYFSTVSVKD